MINVKLLFVDTSCEFSRYSFIYLIVSHLFQDIKNIFLFCPMKD